MTTDIQAQIVQEEQNLLAAQQNSDQATQLKSWDNLGDLYSDLRDYPQSIHAYQQAKSIASQRRDINLLFRIGIALSVLHEYQQSMDCLKEALQISLTDSTKSGDALRILGFIGDQYKTSYNDIPQAITFYQQVLELAQKMDRANHQYRHLRHLGECFTELGDTQQAIHYYEQGLTLVRQNKDQDAEATLLTAIAFIFAKANNQEQATNYFEQALAAAQTSSDTGTMVHVLIWWGHAYRDHNDFEVSSDYYRRALALAQDNDDVDHISSCLSLLARLSQKQGKLQEAVDLYKQEVQLLNKDRLKSPDHHQHGFRHFSYTNALESLGKLYEEMNNIPQALGYMEQALASETIRSSVLHLNEHIIRLKQKLDSTLTNDAGHS